MSSNPSEAVDETHTERRNRDSSCEVKVNVYDLLPPSNLSSLLWVVGSSVLHSGVVVDDREYAYGGHNNKGLTGVYWTKPGLLPPGATFRCELAMGAAQHSKQEVEQIIREMSQEYLGPSWNLLTNNCNHFTSSLCHRLTAKTPPAWLNRAASIGISLPCFIPRHWLSPPTAETADGELVEEDGDEERAAMLPRAQEVAVVDDEPDYVYASPESDEDGTEPDDLLDSRKRRRRRIYRTASKTKLVAHKDSSGRGIPVSERAPVTKD